jgi:hypothetical protein
MANYGITSVSFSKCPQHVYHLPYTLSGHKYNPKKKKKKNTPYSLNKKNCILLHSIQDLSLSGNAFNDGTGALKHRVALFDVEVASM